MFGTVVVATDGSDSAKRGIRTALDIADRFDADVHGLYVIESEKSSQQSAEDREAFQESRRAAGDDALSFVRDEAGDRPVTTAVREGDPAPEIIGYAEDVEADAIALGTRGRHGEHAFLLGSVAEAVVREAPIPVLTVRQLSGDEALSLR